MSSSVGVEVRVEGVVGDGVERSSGRAYGSVGGGDWVVIGVLEGGGDSGEVDKTVEWTGVVVVEEENERPERSAKAVTCCAVLL